MSNMNKILNNKIISVAVFSLISTSLFSEELIANDYNNAQLNFQKNNYKETYIYINKYLEKNKINKSIAFMLGRSAYEIGKFEEALSAFNLILMEEPSNSRVKLEIAQTYLAIGNYDKSEKIFEDILKNDSLPPLVKKNIELTLASLKQKNKKNYLRTTLMFGYGYDSNIENYSSEYLDLSSNNEKKDRITDYVFSLNHKYKFLDNLALENKFLGYSQKYLEYDEKNIDLIVLGTALVYYKGEYKYSLGFDYNHVWLDKTDYLNNYIFSPSIQYKIDKDLEYKSEFKVLKKDFKQADYEYKDSTLYEWQNSFILSTVDYGVNTFSLSFGRDNKDKGRHYNVDNDFVSLRYENLFTISKSLILNNSLEYYKDIYKEKSLLLDETRRKDDKFAFNTGLIKSINENFAIGANVTYIDNNSNQELFYSYDKYLIKSNIYYSF